MPIKGLSEKLRFPRLGKIRIGEKTEAGFPRSLDHFGCPDEVKKIYGEQPKELDIIFPVDDEEVIFPQYLKMYGKTTGLKCKGDGETAIKYNKETGEFEEIECLYEECPDFASKNCREVASLQFLIPKVNGLGVYQIDTSGSNSIRNINSTIKLLKSLTKGRISGIPLKLAVTREEVQAEGHKQTVSVLSLRVDQFNLNKFLSGGPAEKTEERALPEPQKFGQDSQEASVSAPGGGKEGKKGEGKDKAGFITQEQLDAISGIAKRHKWSDEDLLFKLQTVCSLQISTIVGIQNLSEEKAKEVIVKLQGK